METLYITTSLLDRIKKYKCSDILVETVINDFKQLGNKVVLEDDSKNPYVSYELFFDPNNEHKNYWNVTEYLQTDSSVSFTYKCLVIMFFIICDGIVNYTDEYCLCGDVGLLVHNLWRDGLVTDDEFLLLLTPPKELEKGV